MKFYRLSGASFYDCINIFEPFLENKMYIFEECVVFYHASSLFVIVWILFVICMS